MYTTYFFFISATTDRLHRFLISLEKICSYPFIVCHTPVLTSLRSRRHENTARLAAYLYLSAERKRVQGLWSHMAARYPSACRHLLLYARIATIPKRINKTQVEYILKYTSSSASLCCSERRARGSVP